MAEAKPSLCSIPRIHSWSDEFSMFLSLGVLPVHSSPLFFFFLISCKVEWLGPSLPNELRAFWFPDSYGICGTAANPTTRACPTVAVGKEYYYFLDFGLY